MNRRTLAVSCATLASTAALLLAPACGGSNSGSGFGSSGGASSSGASSGKGGSSGASSGASSGIVFGGSNSSGSSGGGSSSGGAVCPSNLQCNVSCSTGSTTITGLVMDPAGADPLYNITAYVPSTTVTAGSLPKGVPTGAAACSCSALFQGDPIVYAATGTDGKFTITNAPVGSNMQVVIQVGKWRVIKSGVTTTKCGNVDLGTIKLPANASEGDMPDIAVSTGGADSLECLLTRVGISDSEWQAGYTGTGHVHIYNGAKGEQNPMTTAPNSWASPGLWDSVADLMQNDVVLLSCEGSPDPNAVPANLETYLNQGGRAFASHFHYSWFAPPTAPADWGNALASWNTNGGQSNNTVGGTVVTTLTGGGTFAKGVAMGQWLSALGALTTTPGGTTVAAPELPVAEPRFNANVTTQAPSQSWIQLDPATDSADSADPTLFFSFDTPIGGEPGTGSPPTYCGRAVFSGLHVGGASYDGVNCQSGGGGGFGGGGSGCNTGHVAAAAPPTGCDHTHPLSPQEKALEFMLFDLSACVIPDTIAPTDDAGTIYIPR